VYKKLQLLAFPPKSFDAVILLDVIEHLSKDDAHILLEKCKAWAVKRIILSTPNGFLPQKSLDKNVYQNHLSGWSIQELKNMGFRVFGLSGLKSLHTESSSNTMGDDILVSIKYRPKILWFTAAAISQLFVYFLPQHAFELFCVMDL